MQIFDKIDDGAFIDEIHIKVIQINKSSLDTIICDESGKIGTLNMKKYSLKIQENHCYKITDVIMQKPKHFAFNIKLKASRTSTCSKINTFKKTPPEPQFQSLKEIKDNIITNIKVKLRDEEIKDKMVQYTVFDGTASMKLRLKSPIKDAYKKPFKVYFVKKSNNYNFLWFTPWTKTEKISNDEKLDKIEPPHVPVLNGVDIKDQPLGCVFTWQSKITVAYRPYTYDAAPAPHSPKKIKFIKDDKYFDTSGAVHDSQRKQYLINMKMSSKGTTINAVCFHKFVEDTLIMDTDEFTELDDKLQNETIEREFICKEAIFTLRKALNNYVILKMEPV